MRKEEIEDQNNIYYIFTGSPYFALDNFYLAPVQYDGVMYTNSEAAFQSAKLADIIDRLPFQTMGPDEAKFRGKNPKLTKLRPDWEEVKDQVMYDIVTDKMARNPQIAELLLSTGDRHIEEGNFWNDLYWGVDFYTKEGKNQLGHTLMRVRFDLKCQTLNEPFKTK